MTQIFIACGTSWTVPADWNSTDNSVETIGGGGGGGTSSGGNDAGGGGGGAYSKITDISLTPGTSVTLQVGPGGSANMAGSDTWFNGASLASSSVGAKGGGGALGPAGDQAGGVGTTGFSGGNGGGSTNSQNGGAGGGGAGGRNGAGKAGALSGGNVGSGGGGAGGGSSTAGSDGPGNIGGAGGHGPEGQTVAPGGAGALAGSSTAGAGTHGSGGGGGTSSSITAEAAGAVGGSGIEFDSGHGAGGGGGGGGYSYLSNANGGDGGLYGGGGGGTAFTPGTGVGGRGAQGLITITYTALTGSTVTAEARVTLGFPATTSRNGPAVMQFPASARHYAALQTEALHPVQDDSFNPNELAAVYRDTMVIGVEWVGGLSVAIGVPCRLEWSNEGRSATTGLTEFGIGILRDDKDHSEWLARRRPGVLVGNVLAVIESLTSGVRISTAEPLPMEWTDPTGVMLVSPQRMLRSPGKIRILAGPGSNRPLRGQ